MEDRHIQRATAYYERLLKSPCKYVRVTVKKGDKHGRRETFECLKNMLTLMGLAYAQYENHYRICYIPVNITAIGKRK